MRLQNLDLSEGTFWKHNKSGDLFRLVCVVNDIDSIDCTIERRSDAATFRLSGLALSNLYSEVDIAIEPETICPGCEICQFEGDGSCIDPARPKLRPGSVTIEAVEPLPRRAAGRPKKERPPVSSYFQK